MKTNRICSLDDPFDSTAMHISIWIRIFHVFTDLDVYSVFILFKISKLTVSQNAQRRLLNYFMLYHTF